MFDDNNKAKWTSPYQFIAENMVIKDEEVVGDLQKLTYSVLQEVSKGSIASLLLLIEKMKMHIYSFYPFLQVSNLGVDKYGQFVLLDGIELQKMTEETYARDVKNSAIVIERLLKHRYKGELPLDVKDLLRALRQKKKTPAFYMLSHPCLIPLVSYTHAYLDIFEHVKNIMPEKIAVKVIDTLDVLLHGWAKLVNKKKLLQAWFSYGSGNRYNTSKAKDLFDYIRNAFSHALQHQTTLGKRYSKKDVNKLIYCKFPKGLTGLYWKIWKLHRGSFEEIECENYFCVQSGACCSRPGFCLRRVLRLQQFQRQRSRKR